MPVHPRFPQCSLSFLLPAASIRRWAAAGAQAGRRPPPKGPQGLDTSRSQRTLPWPEARTQHWQTTPPRAGYQTRHPRRQSRQPVPAAQHPIPAHGTNPATHGTGRGASFDREIRRQIASDFPLDRHRSGLLPGYGPCSGTSRSPCGRARPWAWSVSPGREVDTFRMVKFSPPGGVMTPRTALVSVRSKPSGSPGRSLMILGGRRSREATRSSDAHSSVHTPACLS